MPFSLDHVVIAVGDLDQAISDYASLGFTVLRGGEHPGRGSVNALIVFEDGSYIELIAFRRSVEGFRWWELLRQAGPGFVDYALLPENMETDLPLARSRGLVMGGMEEGSRLTPEGTCVEWKTARSPTSDVPFLCGDVTPRALRVPEGEARRHPNRITGVSAVTIAVRDLAASVGRYLAILPEGLREKAHINDRGSSTASFDCGKTVIKLVTPQEHAAQSSKIEQHLELRGEGVFSVELMYTRQMTAFGPALTHGARLELSGNGS
jgi:catechol 2,3-dioxygenase-like lactoylglutathione lyase family enzyme